ncbi:MAG: 4'-phosphopantetheinyl transferase family protein [Parahaliea sp.]
MSHLATSSIHIEHQCWLYQIPDSPFGRRRQSQVARRMLARMLLSMGCEDCVSGPWRSGLALKAHVRQQSGFEVSISHSGPYVALVLSKHAVGIDIECSRRERNWLAIAESFFEKCEVGRLRALSVDERRPLFLQMWAIKEAGLKMAEGSLFDDLNRLCIGHDAVIDQQQWPQTRQHWCWSGQWQGATLALYGQGQQTAIEFWICRNIDSGSVQEVGASLWGTYLPVQTGASV